jgi:hypothetical protein
MPEKDESKAQDERESREEEQRPGGLARFLSIVLAVLIALVVPLSLLAWDIYRTVFNPPLMKTVLTDIVTNSDLIPVALEWYANVRAEVRAETTTAIPWVDEPDIIELLAILDLDDWRAERFEVLPNEILTPWVHLTVDGTYAWIDSTYRNPQIVWPMQPLKDRVNSEHGHNAIQIVYDALEPCVPEQIADLQARLAAAPQGKEVPYNLCAFPEPWTEDQFNDYHDSLLDVVAQIPPQFHLTGELEAVEDVDGVGPETLKGQLRLTRTIGRYAPLAALALLLIAALWAIKRWRSFGRRWGIGLLIGGLALLAVSLLYATLIITLLGRGPLSEAPPLVLSEAAVGVIRVGREIFRPALIQAIIVCVVAVVSIVLASMGKRERRDETQEDEAAEPAEA